MVPSLSTAAAAGLVSGARSLGKEALAARVAAERTADPVAATALRRAARGMESYAYLLSTLADLLAPGQ